MSKMSFLEMIIKNRYIEENIAHSKRLRSIEYLGGKCVKCNITNPIVLTFHHKESDKEDRLSRFFLKKRWDVIKTELDKCELMCENCHMELHYGEKDRKDKKLLLEFKGQLSCEKCGYNNCMASLDFHHLDPEVKDFRISSVIHIKYTNVGSFKDSIEDELDKCIVLCRNCHKIEHFDQEFFENNKNLIETKINNIRHKQYKIDRNEIKKMYNNGMKQSDIAKFFKTSKSTISIIVKELNL